MIFSVFNYNTKKFDYFEAPGTSANYGGRGTKYRPLSQPPQGPTPQLGGRGPGIGLVGFAPEALGVALPAGARRVGSGSQAKGCVACPRPAYPGRYEERGGTIQGLSGFGDAAEVLTQPAIPVAQIDPLPGHSLGSLVLAACVASVVGVIVQKALK